MSGSEWGWIGREHVCTRVRLRVRVGLGSFAVAVQLRERLVSLATDALQVLDGVRVARSLLLDKLPKLAVLAS